MSRVLLVPRLVGRGFGQVTDPISCPSGYTPVNPSGLQWTCWPPNIPLPPTSLPTNTTANTAPTYIPTTATIQNISRPGQSFQVGDQWSLSINGNAGVSVTGSASQNGATVSTSQVGTTDSAGQLTLTGTFGAGDIGTWQESYLVGSGSPFSLSFSVAAAPASTSNGNPSTTSTISPTGTAVAAPVTTGFDLSFLTNSISILGFNVPVWALIAVAGGGLLLVTQEKKR